WNGVAVRWNTAAAPMMCQQPAAISSSAATLQTKVGIYLNIEKACSASKPSPKANVAKAIHGPGATIDGTSSPASRGCSAAAAWGNPVDVSMAYPRSAWL